VPDDQAVPAAADEGLPTASAPSEPFPDAPLFREAVERREVVLVPDPAREDLPPDLVERAAAARARVLLIVPMTARSATVGVFTVARDGSGPTFSESDSRLAQTVADTLAAAVENEWLHQREKREAAVRERRHLARELHDAVTQTIYSASLIADALPEVWERDVDEGRRTLTTLRHLVRGALAEMRTLLFELRPGALSSATLDTLLERLGVALSGQIQSPVNVSVEETVAVPEDVKIALYRVAQEAFSNIAKYARARRVTASLKADAAGAVLRVADDGRGFAPTSVTPERMGLRIMRERLDQIGASLDVDSAPGRGTTVVVTWRRDADDRPEIGEEGGREQLEAHSSDDRG
jgi:signal transduction histidine kinase